MNVKPMVGSTVYSVTMIAIEKTEGGEFTVAVIQVWIVILKNLNRI